jgi:hypothetical protein
VAFGVRDQLDRELVDARISGQRTGRQLRQLAVEPARHARADLANVLEDDVPVVEQPFPRGGDVDAAVAGERQLVTRLIENATRFGESREKRPRSKRPARWRLDEPLTARDGACVLGEALRAEELAADGPDERWRAAVATERP